MKHLITDALAETAPQKDTFRAIKHTRIGDSNYFVAEDAKGFQRIEVAPNVGKTNLEHSRLVHLAQIQVDANNHILAMKTENQSLPKYHPFAIASRLKKSGLKPGTRNFRRVYRKEKAKTRS